MEYVRPKKHLGQHFLTDENIAQKIVHALSFSYKNVLEIGPGKGVLTKFLIAIPDINLKLIEIDVEAVAYLNKGFPQLENKVIYGDFLEKNFLNTIQKPLAIIGNFPYNIGSQILFKIIENRNDIPEVVCMLQKEVAERLASKPRTKTYGILSVLLQAYYDIAYLFTVDENVFTPPPKVKSGVVRLIRNKTQVLNCNEKLFFAIVKTGFNQRRKTLRNSLHGYTFDSTKLELDILQKRAEELTVDMFVGLANSVLIS